MSYHHHLMRHLSSLMTISVLISAFALSPSTYGKNQTKVISPPATHQTPFERLSSDKACLKVVYHGIRKLAETQTERFLGKVDADRANCRGGKKALERRPQVWVDWANYYATGDASTKVPNLPTITKIGEHTINPNQRGLDGSLLDLEYQRMELIRFNLNDNNTYEKYIKGDGNTPGHVLKTWDAMKLPKSHPQFDQVTQTDGKQVCSGELIRYRTLTGICNDIYNPAMGSTNQLFARNMRFEATFPELGKNELARNRHGDRLALLQPDPQVISRKLFTRSQSKPEACNTGLGLPDNHKAAHCDYKKAPFFNVLAAYWIQFMTHDWFSHVSEGHNDTAQMAMGCATQKVNNTEKPLTTEQVKVLGCRPDDRIDVGYVAQNTPAPNFEYQSKSYLARAHKTTENKVTAWWDASQIYGYDDISSKRVKRDPNDTAKLLMQQHKYLTSSGEKQGYLPVFNDEDLVNPDWKGQEVAAFPDNWTVGMSFYHNLFVREHNQFVDAFRTQTKKTPQADSGLRNPAKPYHIITYQEVGDEELFQAARLVVAAEIAKIHTVEWTTQLLYNETMNLGMNANWNGLVEKNNPVSASLQKIVINHLAQSSKEKKANQFYSAFAAGAGIFGLGSHRYVDRFGVIRDAISKKDIWDIRNPEHVNGGVNHFGSPFNFPEEFPTVYRLHPLLPDLLEYRELKDPNRVNKMIPIISTFRGKATQAMVDGGLSNWALSMGRQRLGLLTLQNHPQFFQNLDMPRLKSQTNKVDIAALDLIRDREHGVPRFNEFRRQYGLTQLTSFDDFINQNLDKDSPERKEELRLIGLMREIYGQHKCDAKKIITDAQLNADRTPINDCLGHPDGSMVDNIEDVDTVVGWLAEFTRPHGFAISETQFHVFILNASRRLFSDRFFTSSFRPEFYTSLGHQWVSNNGPGNKQWEPGLYNGHKVEVSPLKRILLRTAPELTVQLLDVRNVFDPWARDPGEYYSLQWKQRANAVSDESFK